MRQWLASANTDDGARLVIAANGFWGVLFSANILRCKSESHLPPQIHVNCYRKHEQAKKRAYSQRVREIEHSSFTPLVLSATGGFGSEAKVFYKRLASLLADKWDQPYSSTTCWLRCRLGFSLLRSAIRSLRGSRSSRGHAVKTPTMADLVIHESAIIC